MNATTPIILKVSAPNNTRYETKQLWDMARDADSPIKLIVNKAVQNPDGSMAPIENVSDKSVEIEMILNGAIARNTRGTVALFMGHTCDPATLPGKDIRVTILDDKGQPTSSKEADDVGFTGDTTYAMFIWDEGSQSGEIRRYVNSKFDVKLGTMAKVFPIDDMSTDITPVPTGCRKPVSEDDINA